MLAIPRRASWAARMVPEKPPPTIATGTRRSDFIIRPVLRISGARSALHHMVVHVRDGLPRSLGEPAGNDGMHETGKPGAHQLRPDLQSAGAMTRPAHSERARMLEKHAIHNTPVVGIDFIRRHGSDPRQFRRGL